MQPPGGGNGVAAWVLQALMREHPVTILSWQPVEIAPINRFFGTHLEPGDFQTVEVPDRWRRMIDRLPVPATLLKLSLLMRYTRKVSADFDLLFGVHNESDFGRRGIQYVHYPTYVRPRPAVDLRWYHTPRSGLRAYYWLADTIAGLSHHGLTRNLTLVNSNWTGEHVRHFLGVDTRTLYPPIVDPAPGLPWSERRSDFLAVGRISPEKEYERIMQILSRVRRHVPDVRLTIIGTRERHAIGYMNRLITLAESLGPWITFSQNITRDEVRRLMASHRYGIHGMREEHFGMAPAELARAGAIVWVPRGGGQREIVDHEPALMYASDDEAVDSILAVMSNAAEQERLRERLRVSSDRFSTDRFVQHVRDIVREFRE